MKTYANKEGNPIRIAFATKGLNYGGAERQLLKLVRGLDKKKYDIHVISLVRRKHHLLDAFRKEAITLHLCNYHSKNPLTLIWLVNIIRQSQFDLIHSFLPRADVQVCMASILCGFKTIICSERGTRRAQPSRYRFWHRLADRLFTFRQAVKVCVNSKFSIQILKQIGCPESKIVVVYNGLQMPLPPISKPAEMPFVLQKGEQLVGMVVRLHPIKTPEIFVKAAAEIIKKYPNLRVKFVLVGDGPLEKTLRKQIQTCNLSNYFFMAGYQSNPEAWISKFDICVLTSYGEGLPNSVMEYMAFRKPVVASSVGGVPELIEHGVNGLLYEHNDHDLLVESIVRLLRNKKEALKMGNCGYKRLVQEFSMDASIRHLDSLYQEVLSLQED